MSPRAPTSLTRRQALRRGAGLLAGAALLPDRWLAAAEHPVQEMIHRTIPSSGERIPVLGMGTWQTFDVGDDEVARGPLRDVLGIFVERGGSVVDASPMYGTSEEVLGDLAAELGVQDDLWWATKVWTDEGRAAGIEQMEASMELLRRPRIELMQVHNLVDAATHLETLSEWKEEGRIDYIGITRSNTNAFPEVERWMDDERLDFVQINYSLREPEAAERLLPKARERGLAVMLNRPLGGGALFGRVDGMALPDWAEEELGITAWSQFFLKWAVSHPAVTCAIPATSNPDHMRENMGAGVGPLPDAAIRRRMADVLA
ncbi:MAG: aldo/keto reductase [Gemmatimonadota bacterium]|nr:aldo/keto reductase [Gemmatimonadota bacterium]